MMKLRIFRFLNSISKIKYVHPCSIFVKPSEYELYSPSYFPVLRYKLHGLLISHLLFLLEIVFLWEISLAYVVWEVKNPNVGKSEGVGLYLTIL